MFEIILKNFFPKSGCVCNIRSLAAETPETGFKEWVGEVEFKLEFRFRRQRTKRCKHGLN